MTAGASCKTDGLSTPAAFARAGDLELIVFEHERERAAALHEAGLRSFMVDHENRGKERRQLGADTEINAAPLSAIGPLASLGGVRVHCRVNAWSEGGAEDVRAAVGEGADRIYLPMAVGRGEVEAFLRTVNGHAEAAILIETRDAVQNVEAFADLPLDAVFVGLNDLAISRGDAFIFSSIRDGLVDRVRAALPHVRLGFAGVTCVDKGYPIPCRLLMSELAALRADFSFMRRSFRADIVGRSIPEELSHIADFWRTLRDRTPDQVLEDRAVLHGLIERLETR
jgi:hypothetical protein